MFLTYFEGPVIPSQQVFGLSSIVVVSTIFVAFFASYLREKIWFDLEVFKWVVQPAPGFTIDVFSITFVDD